jgi:hypothetical protein
MRSEEPSRCVSTCFLRATREKSRLEVSGKDNYIAILNEEMFYDFSADWSGGYIEYHDPEAADRWYIFEPPETIGWFYPYWKISEQLSDDTHITAKPISGPDETEYVELKSFFYTVRLDCSRGLLPVSIVRGGMGDSGIDGMDVQLEDDMMLSGVFACEVVEAEKHGGMYLPKRIVASSSIGGCGFDGDSATEAEALEIKLNAPLPDSLFEVKLVEGMDIIEFKGGKGKRYRVGAGGEEIPVPLTLGGAGGDAK